MSGFRRCGNDDPGPSQVLANITSAMEWIEHDVHTVISIEADIVSINELASMIHGLAMGPMLAVHVVNNAVRILTPCYPAELVRSPLPLGYDLRQILPMSLPDRHHETAKTIFNRRLASSSDLGERDIAVEMEGLDWQYQMQVFNALFCMYGTKLGAVKNRTGIA